MIKKYSKQEARCKVKIPLQISGQINTLEPFSFRFSFLKFYLKCVKILDLYLIYIYTSYTYTLTFGIFFH